LRSKKFQLLLHVLEMPQKVFNIQVIPPSRYFLFVKYAQNLRVRGTLRPAAVQIHKKQTAGPSSGLEQ
ncbi:MAG: hypothetical protein AAFY91_17925, partial [Bacteroidota bacterium]